MMTAVEIRKALESVGIEVVAIVFLEVTETDGRETVVKWELRTKEGGR